MIHGLVKKILEKVFGILLRAEVLMLGHFGPTQTRPSDSTNAKLPIFFFLQNIVSPQAAQFELHVFVIYRWTYALLMHFSFDFEKPVCLLHVAPGRVAQSVGHLTRKSGVLGSIPGLATYFRFSFRFFKKGSCQLLAKVCARSTG